MMIDIVRDPTFMHGFLLCSEKRSIFPQYEEKTVVEPDSLNRFGFGQRTKAPFQNVEPDWFLEQCFMRHQLATDITMKIGKRSYSMANASKKVERKPGGELILSLFAHKEYKAPRRLNEGWPYFAVAQSYDGEFLSRFRSLKMRADIIFNSFKDCMDPADFNPELHTFQVIWYLVIGNLNVKSKGFGDFFHYGLPLIDKPRMVQPIEYNAEDYGNKNASHMFLHLVDSHRFLSQPLEVGQEANFSYTCLQDIKDTFHLAQAKGYMKNSKWEDLEICQMIFGIEAEGTYDGSVTLASLSLEKEI